MTSSEIVSAIEMQFNDKYHEKGFVFKKSSRGDSFYLVAKRGNKKPIQIRLSDHGTYVKTWTDLANKKDSTIRLVDPSFSINYSIVFIDNGNSLTSDCIGQPNCENCKIPECIPQELKGVTDKKHTYQVMQYVYDSSVIKMKYIQGFVNVIYQTIRCGKFIDPLSNAVKKQNDNISLARKARQKQLRSIFIKESQLCNMILESVKRVINIEHSILLTTESKNNKNMKKNVQRINESQLRAIVAESVKKLLREDYNPYTGEELKPQANNQAYNFQINAATQRMQQPTIISLLDKSYNFLNNATQNPKYSSMYIENAMKLIAQVKMYLQANS